MNLLIVDDYPANRKLMRAALEVQGHCVEEAGNGIEALRLLERQPMDAVISDILMPGMDGFRLSLEMHIRRHGGALWADATPDGGATFFFSLRRV